MKKIFIIVLSFLFFSNLQFASASLYDQASSESSHTYSSNVNNGTTASWTVSNLPASPFRYPQEPGTSWRFLVGVWRPTSDPGCG